MTQHPPLNFDESQIGCKSHFLDSGSFSFWSIAADWAKSHGGDKWGFYKTVQFRQYLDDYAAFIKKGIAAIDHYSNVDVIPNPELSYRNLKYLENKHGLNPVPVVHYPCDHSHIVRHMNEGYTFIAIGGLVGSHGTDLCRQWLDRAFDIVCNGPERIPKVKIHGFGVTSYELLLRYPWWSTDSAYWTKQGLYGSILVPHYRKGAFTFDEQPYSIYVSNDSPARKEKNRHYWTMPLAERFIVDIWLDRHKINIGETALDGEVKVLGVTNNHSYRKAANIYFFRDLEAALPKWPWPFHGPKRGRGFNIKVQDK